MAHTQSEIDELRECVREIIDEKYFPTLHEIRKKLAISDAKLQEATFQLSQKEIAFKKFEECHKCHELMVERANVSTQVVPEDIVAETNVTRPQSRQQQSQTETEADDDIPSDLNISDEDLEPNRPEDVTIIEDGHKEQETHDNGDSLPATTEAKTERVSPSDQAISNGRNSDGFVTPTEGPVEPEVICIDSD